MPKKFLSGLFGRGPDKRRRERHEPGTADQPTPDVGDNWNALPEAPDEIRDLKWADRPLRARPKQPEPAPAAPTAVELAQPVTTDPSLGLRKRSSSAMDTPVSIIEQERAEAPEAAEALLPPTALELPVDVVTLESDVEHPADGRVFEPVSDESTPDPRLDLALYEAARSGRVDDALRLIEQGANPHALPADSSRDRRTLPLIAAVLPDLRLLRALIAQGSNLNDCAQGITPLLAACRDSWHGRPDAVMTLIANGSDVRRADPDGNTPLHHAARSSDPGVAAMLMDAASDLNALNAAGQPPLGIAMEAGNFRLGKFLLDKGAHADPLDARPPLIDAAANDDDDVGGVQLLLRHKVRINGVDSQGRTALHHAAMQGNLDIIDLLLDAGAEVKARDDHGMTPLLLAAANGRLLAFRRIRSRLGSEAADALGTDNQGNNAMHLAIGSETTTAELMQELKAAGVDPQAKDAQGRSAMDLCARNGRWKLMATIDSEFVLPTSLLESDLGESTAEVAPIAVLREALDRGEESRHADLLPLLNAQDLGLLMHCVSGFPTPQRLRWLLGHGADLQVRDMNGDTVMFSLLDQLPASLDSFEVLHHAGAAPTGRGGMARFLLSCVRSSSSPIWTSQTEQSMRRLAMELLDRGVDPFARSAQGHSALELAVTLGWGDVVRRLLDIGADVNHAVDSASPLHVATQAGRVEIVKDLLLHGASPNQLATDGQAPLGLALTLGHDDLVRWLDWRKWRFPNRKLRAADLPAAAMVGDLEAVRRLLDLGFDVDTQDDRSCTALLRAAGGGHRAVVQLLLKKGADTDIAAISGATPLSAAASMRQLTIVDDLTAAGADVNRKLAGDLSVLNLSAALGLSDVVDKLLDAGADLSQLDGRGRTALHCAAMQGFNAKDAGRLLELLEVILQKGGQAFVNTEASGATPLLLLLGSAAEPGTQALEEVVIAGCEKLIQSGATLDVKDPRGFTPLHLAALHGLSSVVRRLLLAGADVEARDQLNRRPQELALMRGYIDISSELETHSQGGAPEMSVATLLKSTKD